MSKPHVLVCGRVHEDGMALLDAETSVSYSVISNDEQELNENLGDADALVIRIAQLAPDAVKSATRLKVVSRHGVGCDNLPVDLLTERGIPIMVTGTANSEAVAEHAIFMMLAVARRALHSDRMVREKGAWSDRTGLHIIELARRRLLLLGFGRIGRLVAEKARALGMHVSVYDPFIDEAACKQAQVEHVTDMGAALREADVLSLHLPSEGEAVIGKDELALLPQDAIVINVARGDLVDETELAKAIKAGKLLGAGVDVFGAEPPAADNPLMACENVIMSPHSAALSVESKRRMGIVSVQNALDVLAGNVDAKMVFNPGWKANSN